MQLKLQYILVTKIAILYITRLPILLNIYCYTIYFLFLGGKGGPLSGGPFCLVAPRDVESFCRLTLEDPPLMAPEGLNPPCCPVMLPIIGEGGPCCPCDTESI